MADRGIPLDVLYRASGRGGTGRPGPASSSGGQPAQLPAPPPALALPPWTVVRPPEAQDFQAFGSLTGLAVGAATVVTGATFQIPANNVGVVRSVTFDVNNLTPTDELTFRLRANQATVEGWAVEIFPRNAATITISFGPDETFVVTPEAAIVDVTAQLDAGGPLDIGASFHGWFVDGDTARRFRDAYRSL